MNEFRRINNITGWGVFSIAAVTYLMTMESTASLWDCGEFIAAAYKLEVGHPPGAPVFMLMGRFFTLFAGSDVTRVALMANALSALASAFTILFLFWSVTHLARRLFSTGETDMARQNIIAVMAAGVTGALSYTFSDTFWFSAVEGEVYATSSLFTAAVFWAILRWEESFGEEHADRWLILIAYLMGLSLGVHLLNLLVIPAIVFVYYFRTHSFSWKGFVISLAVSLALLVIIMYGIIPGVLIVASKFELLFINGLGMPFNSGIMIYALFLTVAVIMAVRWSMDRSSGTFKVAVITFTALALAGIWLLTGSAAANIIILIVFGYLARVASKRYRRLLNTALTSLLVILIGYSSFALILIRSSANPPMDENNPEHIFNLIYYLNREQYGQRPLLYGHYYNAPVVEYTTEGKPTWNRSGNRYVITNRSVERVYDERFNTIFPRMWSDQQDHIDKYIEWGIVKGKPVQVTDPSTGERRIERKPTFIENLRFMAGYQIGFMYMRYFMWNFSGRQNDVQNYGGSINGNWITGIGFIDRPFTGDEKAMPAEMKNDQSRNRYFLLPLLLGLAGFFYQLNRDIRNWWIVMLLFVLTGLAIVIYLNQSPNQPRERDYAYAGSFYAFAMWIGIGVLWVYKLLSRVLNRGVAAVMAGIISVLAVPAIMAAENWHDHDRSGRYLTVDVASNYLNSCAPGAILFTNGDNDTFPLWYAQEVEGVRTDVRVCNLMLLNTDWYIDQMKQKAYESDPLPLSLPVEKYYDGINNQVFIVEKIREPVDVSLVIDFFRSESRDSKIRVSATEEIDYIPARTIRIPVDREKVLASGTVKPEDADLIVPHIDITLKGNSILKSQMMVLDLLAGNQWERPVYFVTGYHNDAMGLEEYFQLEGIAYRLVPVRSHNRNWLDYGRIDTAILYENLMNRFRWRGASDPDVYLDYYHKRTITVIRARHNYARLASALASEGDREKAAEVLERCISELPFSKIPHDMFSPDIVSAFFAAGLPERAVEVATEAVGDFFGRTEYFLSQRPGIVLSAEYEIQTALQYASRIADIYLSNGLEQEGNEMIERLEKLYAEFLTIRRSVTGEL
ncbi:MAG: DUF2723 domain-containing protein [Bacteroidetes bacterium]|nr:DUF2723 domain-containing protein [Bacteroidota bacterium]